jgi:tetratricopeptide (TPR) repeat protein
MKNLIAALASLFCVCTNMSAQNSDSSRYYFNKGIEENQSKRYLVASKFFDRAIGFDPTNAEAYIQNGYTNLAMKKTDAAKNHFTKAHELQPKNVAVIKELTELYYSYRQFDKAIQFAQKCESCESNSRILGMSYYQQEDYMNAEKHLKAALVKNPGDADAMYTMGRNYLDMEEYRKAVPFYAKAVEMNDAKNNWMYELGLLYYNLNDYKNALASFTKAVDNGYAQTNDVRENMGYASLYTGQFDKGEELLMEIYKRKPGNKDILRDIAEILYQQKQYDRSLGYCQKLMEIDMKDGKALYQAGLCFQKKGEKDRGQQMCDKAIELDPSLDNLRKKKDINGL